MIEKLFWKFAGNLSTHNSALRWGGDVMASVRWTLDRAC